MPTEFLYFDLGKVLVDFTVERMLRQVARVAGLDEGCVKDVLFDGKLQRRYESGQVTSRQFYDAFCEATDTRPDYDALAEAGSDIFELIPSMLPVVTQLREAGYRLGILSNTCELHWEHCVRRFPIVADGFHVHALSYRIGACKPDAKIFHAAAEMAGHPAEEIFFVDDLPEHITGAKAVGFDAVQYTSTRQLVVDLRARGIRFNY